MLTVGNKAVIPYSGSSQESPRTGKTKRSQSSQLSVKTCERENRVNRLFSPAGRVLPQILDRVCREGS